MLCCYSLANRSRYHHLLYQSTQRPLRWGPKAPTAHICWQPLPVQQRTITHNIVVEIRSERCWLIGAISFTKWDDPVFGDGEELFTRRGRATVASTRFPSTCGTRITLYVLDCEISASSKLRPLCTDDSQTLTSPTPHVASVHAGGVPTQWQFV